MFNLKRLGSIALSLTMVFSMAGCGSRSTTVKKSAADVNVEDVESISDALEISQDYTAGNYKFDFSISDGDSNTDIKASVSGKTDGTNATAAISFDVKEDGESLSYDLGEILTIADGRAYIDVDKIISAVLDIDTELGSYGLLLPEYEDITEASASDNSPLVVGLAEALLKDIETEKNGDEFVAKIDTVDAYKNTLVRVIDYIADNKDEFSALYNEVYSAANNSAVADMDYINDLFDDISADFVSAAAVFGIPISDDTVAALKEEVIAEVEETMDSSYTDVDFDFDDIDELKKQLDQVTDAEWEEAFGGVVTEVRVKATNDQFALKISFDMDNDEAKCSADISYTFDVDSSIKVTKPSNAATLTDMANYLKDNTDVLEKLMTALGIN